MKNTGLKFRRSALYPLAYGLLTGALTGAFVALFAVCAKVVGEFIFGVYAHRDGPLAVICIITLVVQCCFLTAVIQTLVPSAKGGGIPLAEGAARGMLKVKWLSTAAALVAGSLLSFLSGLPLGSEGPSIGVGALIGEGVGKGAKKPVGFRRYLITGGASSGLAAALNVPLTGLCFAFEETHRRFSPYILASSFAAVAAATAASQAIFFAFSFIPYLKEIGVAAGFSVLSALKPATPIGVDFFYVCIAALCAGAVCALFGAAFNRAAELFGKLFGKVRSPLLRLLPVFLATAVIGLFLYLAVGSGEAMLSYLSIDSALWLVLTLLAVRFIMTTAVGGAKCTGGLFLPMIAVGALIGLLAAKTCVSCGLSEAYAPNIIVICVCAFFAASVRAPITAIVMSVELTASFVNLLPCLIAVAAAAVIADLTKTEPLYEKMLENLVMSAPSPENAGDVTVKGAIPEDSPIAFKRVREIMWPYNSLVTELDRGGVQKVPDGETILLPNDILTVRAENIDRDHFYSLMSEYITLNDEVYPAPEDNAFSATAQNK